MELNPEIFEVLKEFKINKDEGLFFLLGVYYQLDVTKVCSEQTIAAMNLTKIVEKDYKTNMIIWNMPLYKGEEHNFSWVKDWVEAFGKVNPDRKGSWQDAQARMQVFFSKYPQYRKVDVYSARDLYFRSLSNPMYCMHSHKFIFDGTGAMKKSTLLQYCEKVSSGESSNNMKGELLT